MCRKRKLLKLIDDVLTNGVYYQDMRFKAQRTFLNKNDPTRRAKERIIVDYDKQCFTLLELHEDSLYTECYQVAYLNFKDANTYWGPLKGE